MYEETMQAYFISLSKKTIHCVTVAPTMKQAEEVLLPFRTAITRHPGPYFNFLTQGIKSNNRGAEQFKPKLFSSKRGIEFTPTGSLLEIRPMSVTKLQGLRPFLSTVDEWLSVDNREDVISALEQGASKLPDYIIIAVSSEGTFRNGSGDDIKLELRRILSGEYDAPHVSIFHYKLDDISEVADPNMWQKASPNIGITVSYQTYTEDVTRAEQVPHARNDILAKRFGLPMEGFTYFFTYAETLPHGPMLMKKALVSLGADLSMGDDFCSFGFLADIGPDLYAFTSLSFITEKTLQKLPPSLRTKYDEFIGEGSLVVLEGTTIDPEKLFEQFDDFSTRYQLDFGAFGYDPYNASAFVKQYIANHSEHCVLKIPQTFKSLSVPLGDIKHLMEDRRIVFWQKIVTYTMGNAMVLKDTLGNQRIYKKRGEHKIDVVAALADAWIARQAHPESFV
jgi:phage terminase large subunit-like protein